MTSQEYDKHFNDLYPQGLVPIRLSAHSTLNNSRFAAVFAQRDKPKERTFRTKGPQGMAVVPGVDAAVETFMKAPGLHNASLAIVEGQRMVYAKGYTWAAPGYPYAQPTTLYRQASVSKALNAIALYRWMQLHPEITLDTKMQDNLQLTTPSGGDPADPDFENITLRHLLENTNGLNNDIIWHDVQPRDAFNSTLPITPMQLARWGASQNLTNVPGGSNQVKYGNAACFYLGLVIAKLSGTLNLGAGAFEAALKTLVLGPLQMSRTRTSRNLAMAQLSGEARYHIHKLRVARSIRDENQ